MKFKIPCGNKFHWLQSIIFFSLYFKINWTQNLNFFILLFLTNFHLSLLAKMEILLTGILTLKFSVAALEKQN